MSVSNLFLSFAFKNKVGYDETFKSDNVCDSSIIKLIKLLIYSQSELPAKILLKLDLYI